jgi:Undecaprenyl-phosphate glucose phosphotransferase
MMVTPARVSSQPRTNQADPAGQPPVDGSATSIERRSPGRHASRGDKHGLSPPVIVGLVRVCDVLLLLVCGWLSRLVLTPVQGVLREGPLFVATIAGSVVAAALLARADVYQLPALRSPAKQIRLLLLPLLLGGSSTIVCLFLMQQDGKVFSKWPFLWLLSSAALLSVWRCYVAWMLRQWIGSGQLARRVAVVGAGQFSREFIKRLRAEADAYTVVGLYDDRLSRIPAVQDGVRVRGTVRDLLARSREERIDLIVVALPLQAVSRIAAILEQVGSAVADVCLTTDFAGFRYRSSEISSIGANPVVLIHERPLKDWRAGKKMAFDLVLGSLLLVLLSPLLALIAVAIRFDSPGPVLFRQPRLGFNNRLFTCYKFRSMHHRMADLSGGRQATRDDPRVTRLGKWLRALSLDELPQLLNVLRGDMSLVGPRPHPPNTKAADKLFTEVVARYAHRHRVKPGITGWAQVNGWRGETATVDQIENRVSCDLAYNDNWSLWLDLRIMLLTMTREILSRNAF